MPSCQTPPLAQTRRPGQSYTRMPSLKSDTAARAAEDDSEIQRRNAIRAFEDFPASFPVEQEERLAAFGAIGKLCSTREEPDRQYASRAIARMLEYDHYDELSTADLFAMVNTFKRLATQEALHALFRLMAAHGGRKFGTPYHWPSYDTLRNRAKTTE